MKAIEAVFDKNGPLSKIVDHYSPRDSQIEMAKTIGNAIKEQDSVIIEAETGIGKTFAYLIPAILSGKKILVSTGTKHLQDQIFEKDIPSIRKTLPSTPFEAALLKGRSNYLCLYRIKTLRQRGRFENKQQVDQFYDIERFAGQDKTGDISKLSAIKDSQLLAAVTSTTENCLHTECPDYEECFIFKARKNAMNSEVVIINHHLFCADLALKQEGFGEILPNAEVIIIDEAHQLSDTATVFFSTQLNSKNFLDWIEDFNRTVMLEASDFQLHHEQATIIINLFFELRKDFPDGNHKIAFLDFIEKNNLSEKFEAINEALLTLIHLIKPLSVRSTALNKMNERLQEFQTTWQALTLDSQTKSPQSSEIIWIETYLTHFSISSTPLDISAIFKRHCDSLKASWIFASATLSINEKFEHFSRPLGITDLKTARYKSPFNYKHNALFYYPEGALPSTNDFSYTQKFCELIEPILNYSKGRAFILFTSYKALNEASEYLKKRLPFPLFIQGEQGKLPLIEAFKKSQNGVLLGTSSFWEGVDVRGSALSCVIIDKLPFSSPGDPIEQAKIDLINQKSGNAFIHYQLPKSIIALKQGVGRLIRDPDDYGLLVIADPRLTEKSYGAQFIKNLPEMSRTKKIERVKDFFDYINKKQKELL